MVNGPKSFKRLGTAWERARLTLSIWGLHFVAMAVLGVSLSPMVYFLHGVWELMDPHPPWLQVLVFSFSFSFGYFFFGVTLITLCILTAKLFGFRVEPGIHPYHSPAALRWMAYNSLILLANAAFLDVLRLSPFQTFFYRGMGAKVGTGVLINTGGLADLSLLEIGDRVTIGGGVALICHAAERGFLRLAPTRLGDGVSIGLGSVIMPDCRIGEGAAVAPCSYLPKGTRIPPKGYWGGNPVQDLRAQRRAAAQDSSLTVQD